MCSCDGTIPYLHHLLCPWICSSIICDQQCHWAILATWPPFQTEGIHHSDTRNLPFVRLFNFYPEIGQPSLERLHYSFSSSSVSFAVLFGVQTRTWMWLRLKSLLFSSTEFIRSRLQSYISVQITQVLQNWYSVDSTAVLLDSGEIY